MDARATDAHTMVPPRSGLAGVAVPVLLSISVAHLLNDMIQALLPALYPMLKGAYDLSFVQIGFLTLTFQITASLLQPLVGAYTDKHPLPYSLVVGMGVSLVGLLLLSEAGSFPMLLVSAGLVGVGSSVFHPESSRVARLASGGRYGMAQSVFQVGGNAGQSLGPLMAGYVVLNHGQGRVAWFSLAALLAMALLMGIGRWYARIRLLPRLKTASGGRGHDLSRRQVGGALGVLVALIFSKYFYLASFTSYYTFYLIEHFGVSTRSAELHLFAFLAAIAAGTIIGGPVGDRIGRKWVIWGSILGVLPFTLVLPHVGLAWTGVLSVVIGLILSSAFSAILVYAQELVPGRVGMISGIFFGFAFGMAGVGAAVLGWVIDLTSIEFVYRLCAFLPLIGLLAAFLPDVERRLRLERRPS